MLKKYLKISILVFFSLAFLGGCATFQHLTTIQPDQHTGPKAADCSSCHVEQFREWSGSPHALAYQNAAFQEAYNEQGGEECLGCHAPLEIRQADAVGRLFNREEGVTCISCHLSDGRMHGPHKSSALFQPHPVQEEDDFYLGVEICAGCHGETYDEYRVLAAKKEVRSCLECHASTRQRTASQGTHFFSNLLVAFEDEVETRSHLISLDTMVAVPGSVLLAVRPLPAGAEARAVEVVIANNVPHNLPTGTFGEKNIQLVLCFLQGNNVVAENVLVVSDERVALMAGEVKKFTVFAAAPVDHADRLEIRLERHASRAGVRPAVIFATKTISLPLENRK